MKYTYNPFSGEINVSPSTEDIAVGLAFDTTFEDLDNLDDYTETGPGGHFSLYGGGFGFGLDVKADTDFSWGRGLQFDPYVSNANGISWKTTFIVKSTASGSRGVGFGFQSLNTVGGRQKSLHWFMSQQSTFQGYIHLYRDEQTTPFQVGLTNMTFVNNDVMEMEVLFDGDVLCITYTNISSGNFEKTSIVHQFTFDLETSWDGTTNVPNKLTNPYEGSRLIVTTGNTEVVLDRLGASLTYAVGDYLVYEDGGWANKGDNWDTLTPNTFTPTIYGVRGNTNDLRQAFVLTSTLTRVMTKNPKVLFIGDSITKGYWSSDFTKTFVEIIRARVQNIDIVNYAQPSARTDSFISPSIDEVVEINPTHVIYLAGSNDIANADTNADIYARVDAQRVILEAAGITFHYVALFPRTGEAIKSYNDYVITQLGAYPTNYLDLYYPFLDPNVADGMLDTYSDDGSHLNSEGSKLASDLIIKYLLNKGIIPALNRG
jgi:lysophospholipase L1-like esterase